MIVLMIFPEGVGAGAEKDGWQSGLMRTPGKRVCRKATRVRIPAHPRSYSGTVLRVSTCNVCRTFTTLALGSTPRKFAPG